MPPRDPSPSVAAVHDDQLRAIEHVFSRGPPAGGNTVVAVGDRSVGRPWRKIKSRRHVVYLLM